MRSALILVAILAVTVRLAFVGSVMRHHGVEEIRAACPDSAEYLKLADNIVAHGEYGTADPVSRHIALARPPGYPLFCAAMDVIGGSTPAVLVVQALLGCWIAVATTLLAWVLLRNRFVALVAGVAVTLSPTGIGLTGVVLAELLFTATLLLGLLLLYFSITHARRLMTIGSGAVFGVGVLIKPALIFWPLATPVIGWLFARRAGVPIRVRTLATCVALQLVFIGGWTLRNGLADGCYTPSIIGPKNLRYYVAPRVEAWVEAGQMPTGSAILTHRSAAWDRDKHELATGVIDSAGIVQRQYAESMTVFRAHPMITARVYLQNIREGLTESWSYLPAQLPAGAPMRRVLEILTRVIGKVQTPAWVPALAGLGVLAWRRRDESARAQLYGLLTLVVIAAMFIALSGTTFWTGSRILYPCEFALIILGVSGVATVGRLVRGLIFAPVLDGPPAESSRRVVPGAIAIVLIAVAGYAPTADTRAGYYIDDYVLRETVVEHGWPGGYLHSWMGVGVRPFGLLHMMAWHRWVWAWPVVQQVALIIQHALVCLMLYLLIREITDNLRAAMAGAAVFAAWHSYTGVVAWTALGAGMLPAAGCLLAALLSYVRHIRCESPTRPGRRWGYSALLFAASLLFYDQQIGAPVLFSVLAISMSPQGARTARLLRTWPFWTASILIGTAYLQVASTAERTLEPQADALLAQIATVAAAFWSRIAASEMTAQWLGRWGAPGAFFANDPMRLALAAAGVLGGALVVCRLLRHPSDTLRTPITRHLAWIGGALTLVSLTILVFSPWTLAPRHTLLPSLGIAMLFAAGFARLRTVGFQRLGTAALMVLIVGLSTLRLGYVYEWTLRTRVADTVVDDLARLCPTPSAGDLVVVDGVQQYGQCFLYSFGFSHEFSADRGVAVDVTTELRSDAGMLLANLDWYDWRPVDLATTHFFQWDETTGHLEPSSFDAYRRRHPDMTVTHEPERKL